MFAQESVMEIQKEREAFEKEMLDSGYVAGNISAFWDEKNQNYDIAITELRMAWHAWKSAKAQAVPEGFVVVPKEPTEAMLRAANDHVMNTHATPFSAYKAMIEAQELAND